MNERRATDAELDELVAAGWTCDGRWWIDPQSEEPRHLERALACVRKDRERRAEAALTAARALAVVAQRLGADVLTGDGGTGADVVWIVVRYVAVDLPGESIATALVEKLRATGFVEHQPSVWTWQAGRKSGAGDRTER